MITREGHPGDRFTLVSLLFAGALLVCCSGREVPADGSGKPDAGLVDAAVMDLAADASPPDANTPELAPPPDAQAPDAGAPFGPARGGAYIMGSSFAMGIKDTIKTFTQESGLSVKVSEWTIGGAPIELMWSETKANNPTLLAAKLAELKSGSYGVLFMNAQQPWRQAEREIRGVTSFTREALKGNPAFRFVIQVYWTLEQDPYKFSDKSTMWEDLAMFRRGALHLAYRVASAIKAPVFVAPVGIAIERVKEQAASGKLAAFKSRAALHEPDGSHLSKLGNYIQASVIHTAAYQDKPHGHSKKLGAGTLSSSDAAIIWDEVLKAVRQTPFSGWYVKAPTTFTAYLAALKRAIRNWETFDNLKPASAFGSGTFTGQDGFTWTYKQGRATTTAPRLHDSTLVLNKGGSLWANIPGGVGELSFILGKQQPGSAAASLEVRVGGKSLGTYSRAQDNLTRLATVITGIKASGPVKLELLVKGDACLLDNLIWTDYPATP